MLLVAIPPVWPYSFYTILRLVVTGVSIGAIVVAREYQRSLVIPFVLIALLFNPFILEVERQVVDSVTEIRGHLTEALDELGENSPGIAPVKAMRAACRRFLDEPHPDLPHIGPRWGHPDGNGFFVALGELRATFGTHLAFLAAQYGIDVEGDLASVLPAEDRG